MNRINFKNNKGFTLIELLATLAILSVVITIVIYAALNIIDSSKEKSYKITINNVEKEASNYVLEHEDLLTWRNSSLYKDAQYQCITVQQLIDKGYFSSDILSSKVSKDITVKGDNYIYLQRDLNTKTLNKKILLHDGIDKKFVTGFCGSILAKGDISFVVNSIGTEYNGYSKSKKVIINYNLYDNVDKISNYEYSYDYTPYDSEYVEYKKMKNDNLNSRFVSEGLEIFYNGSINANITNPDPEFKDIGGSLNIEKIDNIKPTASISSINMKDLKTVTADITLVDNESGIDTDKGLSKEKIVVKIGDNVVSNGISLENSGNEYILTIINEKNYAGEVKIRINEDAFYDNVGNENGVIDIDTNVSFKSVYKINYYLGNGGETAASKLIGTTECMYEQSCTLKTFSDLGGVFPYSKEDMDINGKENFEWVFYGWGISDNDTSSDYSDGAEFKYNTKKDINLYAIGRKSFKFFSGSESTLIESAYQYWNPHSTAVSQLTSIKLPEPTAIDEWNFKGYKDGNNLVCDVTYNNSLVSTEVIPVYNANVNNSSIYERNLTISYDGNGHTGGSTSDTSGTQCFNTGTSVETSTRVIPLLTIAENGFIKKSHTFTWWNTKQDGTGDSYAVGATNFVLSPELKEEPKITLYAQWKGNKVTIKYSSNGGEVTATNKDGNDVEHSWSVEEEDIIYKDELPYMLELGPGESTSSSGLANYNYYKGMEIYYDGREAINGKEWICLEGCYDENGNIVNNKTFDDTKVYSASDFCDLEERSCDIILGVNWSPYVTWDFNFGKTFSTNQYMHSGRTLNWDKNFTIEVVFNMPATGSRRLIVGNYSNDKATELNIEVTKDNKLRVYYANGKVDKKSSGTITAKEDVEMKFIWLADYHRYIVTAVGEETNIYMSGKYEVNGTSSNSLRVGARDLRDADDTFGSMTVKTFKHGRAYNVGQEFSVLSTPKVSTGSHVFDGWFTDVEEGTKITKTSKPQSINDYYYAHWSGLKKVKIRYDANGGTVKSPTKADDGTKYTWTTTSDGIIKRNDAILTTSIYYGGVTGSSGLVNYNNSKYLKITRDGYTAVDGAEWKCLKGCKTLGKTFSQNKVYADSAFCDASEEDCEVILGVNWKSSLTRYVTAKNGLNCRKGPGTSYAKKTSLSCGKAIVGYYNSAKTWFYYAAGDCYVSASYISSTKKSCYVAPSTSSSSDTDDKEIIVDVKEVCDSCTADSQCMSDMVCQPSGCVNSSGNYYRCCGYRANGGHTVMRCD